MSTILPTLLNWLQAYGYPVLWLSVFLSSVGVPIPTPLTLLAAGAFAEVGDFNVFLLGAIAITASVCGDSMGYYIGRRWGTKVIDWLEHSRWNRFISARTIRRSRVTFKRLGVWAVFFTRFLFPALGGIVNLLAGADIFPYRYFLSSDIAGEILSAAIPLSLGYAFGASWEAVGDVLGSVSLLLLALLFVVILLIYLLRALRHSKETESSPVHEFAVVRNRITRELDTGSRKSRSDDLPLS